MAQKHIAVQHFSNHILFYLCVLSVFHSRGSRAPHVLALSIVLASRRRTCFAVAAANQLLGLLQCCLLFRAPVELQHAHLL